MGKAASIRNSTRALSRYLGESVIKTCFTGSSKFGGAQEGYVVRLAEEFSYEKFSTSVAKFVRKNHVQTDQHWMQNEVEPNQLTK